MGILLSYIKMPPIGLAISATLKELLSILTVFAKATGYNWSNWQRMIERTFPKFNQDGSVAQEIDFTEVD